MVWQSARIESLQSEVARLQESEAAWKQSAQAAGEAAKMDDVGTLLRERNALQSELAAANARIIALMDLMLKDEAELATVKAENEKLRRDAERYRWLRSAEPWDDPITRLQHFRGYCSDALDMAIDAALGSQPEGSQVAPGADEIKAERDALIYAVARKFPGESRFQTALRYITEAENRSAQCTGEAALPPKEGG
jgi:hypothetical protein